MAACVLCYEIELQRWSERQRALREEASSICEQRRVTEWLTDVRLLVHIIHKHLHTELLIALRVHNQVPQRLRQPTMLQVRPRQLPNELNRQSIVRRIVTNWSESCAICEERVVCERLHLTCEVSPHRIEFRIALDEDLGVPMSRQEDVAFTGSRRRVPV